MKRPLAWLLVLLIPPLFLLPYLNQFPFPALSNYSDLAISHYPNAIFLLRSLTEFHQVPFWSPSILSGYPFAANPLSGLWYVPGWLALLFPLPLGFNLVEIFHMLFGGLGMVLFLRKTYHLQFPSAVTGGIVFEALPRYAAHYASGHLMFVYAIAWTPWLLLAAWKEAQQSRDKLVSRVCFWQGIILGLIILADVRWAVYSGLLWLPYSFWQRLKAQPIRVPIIINTVKAVSIQVGLALLLAAPLLLPLLEYLRLASRNVMGSQDSLFLSLPVARLFGLIFPSMDGNTEWAVYPGAFATLTFFWIAVNRNLRQKFRFWIWLVVISMFLALGSNLPGGQLLARLPGLQLLRVPPRFVLLAGFGFAVMSANIVQILQDYTRLPGRGAFAARLVVAGIMGFSLIAVAGMWAASGEAQINLVWGASATFIAGTLVLLRDNNRLQSSFWVTAVVALILVDLIGISCLGMYFRPANAVLGESQDIASYLHNQAGIFRVYTPSYSLPQQTSADYQIELANGIDPLQLAAYTRFMEKASGVPLTGYDVTLPPFANGNPCCDNAGYQPDARELGLLNVRYIASDFDIHADGLKLVREIGRTRVYLNEDALPRAWTQSANSNLGSGVQPISDLQQSPNSIQLLASGPGLVVLSELNYPGWQVFVDGKKETISVPAGLLRGIEIGPGPHVVRFIFSPVTVWAGLVIAGLSWLVVAFLTFRSKRKIDAAQ